jgi:DHA1 family tetracycline resistance protein-like MFS transporter
MASKSILVSIFIIVFFGFVGFTLPIPILPEMILDPSYSFVKGALDEGERTFLLGILIAIYPLGQFFGNPILGILADRIGRRIILLSSLFVTFFGYVLTAFAVHYWDITFLFIGRFICGFAEGNVTIAQSAMADISTPANKVRNFSLINVAASLGFVFGPLIGGKLSDNSLIGWFNLSTPFWCAAILTIVTLIYSYYTFKETAELKKCDLHKGLFESITHVIKVPMLGSFLLLGFIFSLGLTLFLIMYPVFFVQKYALNPSELAEIIAFTALPFIFSQLFVLKPLHNWMNLEKSTIYSTLFLGIFLILFTLPTNLIQTIFFVFPIGVLNLIVFVNGTVLISNHAPKEIQGNVLGLNQSLYVLATVFAGFAGGYLGGIWPGLPFIAAGIVLMVGSLLLYLYIKTRASS